MNYQFPEKIKILDGNILKLIAIFCMFLDHVGKVLLDHPALAGSASGTEAFLSSCRLAMDGIGRISFPVFCFFLTEGFLHTRSKKKYFLRLLIFSLLSEIPFDLAFSRTIWQPEHQNVLFTFLFGFLLIWEWEHFKGRWYLQISLAALAAAAAWFLKTDYGVYGILLIFVLYLLHGFPVLQCTGGALLMSYEWPSVFGFLLLSLYSGKRGRQKKYFFYIFYPAHLLLLYLLSVILYYRI